MSKGKFAPRKRLFWTLIIIMGLVAALCAPTGAAARRAPDNQIVFIGSAPSGAAGGTVATLRWHGPQIGRQMVLSSV